MINDDGNLDFRLKKKKLFCWTVSMEVMSSNEYGTVRYGITGHIDYWQ
jgi:hypothetical protein